MVLSLQAPRVTVVVATDGSVADDLLRASIESAAEAGGEEGVELDVVLAGPAIGAVATAGAFALRLPEGTTRAAAVNEAVAATSSEWVLVLDAGARLGSGALTALLATAGRRKGAGIVAGATIGAGGTLLEAGPLLFADGTIDFLGGGRFGAYDFERPLDASSSAALLVRRDIWGPLGGLDGTYHPDVGAEKLDLCLRAAGHGWSTWYQPSSVVSAAEATRALVGPTALSTFARRWSTLQADREPPGHHEAALWRAAGEPLRLLVIDDELPDERRGSGYGRMHDVVSELDADLGLQVSFHPRLDPGERSVPELAAMAGPRTRVVPDLEGHLASDGVDFEVVVVSRPDNALRYRELIARRLPGAAVIYDAEALFFRRLERRAELADGDERTELLRQAADMAELEADLAAWADRVVTVSEEEASELRPATAGQVHVVSPRRPGVRPTPSGFSARSGGCLVAGWSAGAGSPNADGLVWFAREVLPRIVAQLPSFRLLVSGDDPPVDVRWAVGPEVELLGGLPELGGLYDRVRVAISPTRFGAGVKVKTVEAIQHGVPVVCTSEAAHGLGAGLATAAWVAPDAPGFADAVVTLASDRRAWERARAAAVSAAAGDETLAGVEQWPAIVRAALADRASGGGR